MIERILKIESNDSDRTDVSSLVDVAFLLLIFFLVTSTLMPTEADLNVHVGGHPDLTAASFPLTIDVGADGEITMDDMELGSGELGRNRLGVELDRYKRLHEAAGGDDLLVVVSAHNEANHQSFVNVVNELTRVELTNFTLSNFR